MGAWTANQPTIYYKNSNLIEFFEIKILRALKVRLEKAIRLIIFELKIDEQKVNYDCKVKSFIPFFLHIAFLIYSHFRS